MIPTRSPSTNAGSTKNRTTPRWRSKVCAPPSHGRVRFLPRRQADDERMKQAVWTGAISFGLVSIPVRLYPATDPKDVRFHLYDRRSGKRVHYERVTREYDPPAFTPDGEADAPPSRVSERAQRAFLSRSSEPIDERIDPVDIVRGF